MFQTLKAAYKILLKRRFNHIFSHPLQSLLSIAVVITILIIPAAFMRKSFEYIFYDILKLELFTSIFAIYIARSMMASIRTTGSTALGKVLTRQVEGLYRLIPERFWTLVVIGQIDRCICSVFGTCLFYSMYACIYGYSTGRFFAGLPMIVLLGVEIYLLFILPEILSLSEKNRYVSSLLRLLALSVIALAIYDIITGKNYLYIHHLPHTVMVQAFLYSFSISGSHELVVNAGVIFLEMALYLLLTLSSLYAVNFSKIKLSMFCEEKLSLHKNASKSKLMYFQRKLLFIPEKQRLLISRELVQMFLEKAQMFFVILQTLITVAVMLGASAFIKKEPLILGIFICVCFSTFNIAVFSLPREGRGIWLLQVSYPNWRIIAMAKFVACFTAATAINLIIVSVYIVALHIAIPDNVNIGNLLYAFFWSILFTQPAVIGSGFCVSSFMPCKEYETENDIAYSYHGLEGVMILLQIFFLALPSAYASGVIGSKASCVLVFIYFTYIFVLIAGGLLLMSRSLKKMQS